MPTWTWTPLVVEKIWTGVPSCEVVAPTPPSEPSDADFNRLLGNHDDPAARLPDALKDALDRAMKEMNGSGIWRSPKDRGVGANPYEYLHDVYNRIMAHPANRLHELLPAAWMRARTNR